MMAKRITVRTFLATGASEGCGGLSIFVVDPQTGFYSQLVTKVMNFVLEPEQVLS
jgi:hypothetical protein